MPHQRLISNHSLEVNPRTGFLAHRRAVILIPRQSGKTTDGLATRTHRAFGFGGPQNLLYSAQDGKKSLFKFLEQERMLRRKPFKGRYTLKTNNNDPGLIWDNGSWWGPGGTEDSGHGLTLDLADIDEAYAQIDNRLEQAAVPAMNTRPNAQLRIYSTAGNLESIYLNDQIARGRELAQSGEPGVVAYIEYSAGPDEDPGDPWTWFGCMPALGFTTTLEAVQAAYDTMDLRDFCRAYLNQTDEGQTASGVIDLAVYNELGDDEAHLVGDRCFALDMANDRSWAAVAAAGVDQFGRPFQEVVKYERGAHWIVPYLIEKLPRNRTDRLYLVAGGAAATLQTTLEAAGINVVVLNRAEYAAACSRWYDDVAERNSRHGASLQVPLDVAVAGAVWSVSDARVWSHAKSTVDICPLVAVTAAGWGYVIESRSEDYDVMSSIA